MAADVGFSEDGKMVGYGEPFPISGDKLGEWTGCFNIGE